MLKDKVVIITGGCSGIGRATAFKMAAQGAKIFIADLSEKTGDEMVDALEKLGTKAAFSRIDVTDEEDVARMIEDCIQSLGTIDVLVNSAGIVGPRSRTERYDSKEFLNVMNVNVNGLFYCTKAVLPHFMNKKSGSIVNLASVAGINGFANHVGYAASKHAVIGITRSTAIEYAKYGIRVNAICPAFTMTPMLEHAILDDDSNYLESLQNAIPMKRFAEADEIADAIVYVASPAASYMTGHSMVLDGGLTVI